MACLNPYLRIKIGNRRWPLEEDGVIQEKALLLMDLPSNRKKLDEVNTPYQVIPCGVCDECYKKRVKEWSIRILNETKYYNENYFITLTYDDAHIPFNHSLDKKRLQAFFKAIKQYFYRNDGVKIKYYGVGEYGEGKGEREYLNPHYHFIGFNIPLNSHGLTTIFPDGHKHWSKSGDLLMYCPLLAEYWPEGFVTIQSVTFGSASYVAGYVHKKLKDEKPIIKQELGFITIPHTGKVDGVILPKRYSPYDYLGVERPFSLMSKGIGEQYIKDNMHKIYATDEVFYNSGKYGIMSSLPPRYFDKKLAVHNADKAKQIKEKRTALSQSKYVLQSDKEYLYNKNVRNDIADNKKAMRKRGLTSLS